MAINWEEFKIYKKEMPHLKGDNFIKLIYFIKSFYNESSMMRIFMMLENDETAKMMLEKRGIDSAVKLERFFNKAYE